jgi:conjugal transfer pilus assembly protein TraK
MKRNSFHNKILTLLASVILIFSLTYADSASGESVGEKAPDRQERIGSSAITALPAESPVTVMPEVAQSIELSSSDVNRITCQGEIKDVVYSREKGITVKFSGRDAFIKFRTSQKEGRTSYSATPSEIFIVCGENVYNIIAIPRRIPARSVRLSPGKMENIRKNRAHLGSLPFEKKVLAAIRSLYTGEIPDSFTVKTPHQKVDVFRDLDLILSRVAVIDGEGLQVKEYRAVLNGNEKEKIELSEKDFLRNEISARPVAVSLDRLVLKKGENMRIFVVELHQEESNGER